jgi:hypothetical protein
MHALARQELVEYQPALKEILLTALLKANCARMIFAPLVLVTMIALKILRNVIQLTEHVKLLPVLLTTLIPVKTLINSALTICALLVQKQEVLNV